MAFGALTVGDNGIVVIFLRSSENFMNSLTKTGLQYYDKYQLRKKAEKKRSTVDPLKENVIQRLKGDGKKEYWKVALEPDI